MRVTYVPRTVPRYGRGWYAHPVRTVRGALGASRHAPPVRTTYPTREAGTRSLYVPNGGAGAYVSARTGARATALLSSIMPVLETSIGETAIILRWSTLSTTEEIWLGCGCG